jgi:hypothetical protein
LLSNDTHYYFEFDKPPKFEAGDLLGFRNNYINSECINTLVSVIVELFL